MALETKTRKIIRRLQREGWKDKGGTKHTKFAHPEKPEVIMVPRHATVTPVVARSIAKAAGWAD